MSARLARLGCGSVSVPVLSKTIVSTVGEPLEAVAGIEHHAVAEHRARRHHLHRRHREAERARAGDDQHGDGDDQRRLPGQAEREPAEEGRQRGQMHDRRVEARGAVGEPHVGRALLDRALRAAC